MSGTAAPLVYNQADTYVPDLLICREEHAARVLAEVAKAAAEQG
jgi:3'(2'), 5'-bisphosphate nucleotidase